ncbi:hypothetical protein LCGC14_1458030, partial [marine sediment metagenome]
NLNRLREVNMKDGALVRRVGNTIKGFLSPSYRRMDASPVFEAFVNKAVSSGFVPYRGMNTDYRYQISFIKPEMIEVAPEEFVVYGLNLTTGDYGSQAMQIEMLVLRIACANLAIGYDLLRKVHLGKRFEWGDGESVIFSERTQTLDSKAVASAVEDVVGESTKHVGLLTDKIQSSAQTEPDVAKVLANIRKSGFGKEIAEKIKNIYETDTGVELLPQKKTTWRLANTLSLIAKGIGNKDKQIDLEKESFKLLAA